MSVSLSVYVVVLETEEKEAETIEIKNNWIGFLKLDEMNQSRGHKWRDRKLAQSYKQTILKPNVC